jgi:hypothetical protein
MNNTRRIDECPSLQGRGAEGCAVHTWVGDPHVPHGGSPVEDSLKTESPCNLPSGERA